jgi:hypothetical protein
MTKKLPEDGDATAVDDVRVVRQAIAAEHAGDMRQHMAETNRIFAELQRKLGLKIIPAKSHPQKRSRIS